MATRTMLIELDEHDYDAIQTAIALRQKSRIWPDPAEGDTGKSSIAGLAIAEICRGYLEMLGEWPRGSHG